MDVTEYTEVVYSLMQQGGTDGFPVIVPDAEQVDTMVRASGRDPDEELGAFAERTVTVSDVAAQAVMAGCVPAYMSIVVPAFEILLEPSFGTMQWSRAEAGYFPWLVVNGPLGRELLVNAKHNVMGPGSRANATIGRAIRLGLVNLAGVKPGTDRSTLGTAWKFAAVLAEDEEGSPWPPYHVDAGYGADENTITMVVGMHPRHLTQQLSGDSSALALAYADEANVPGHYSAASDSDDPLFGVNEAEARRLRGVLMIVAEDHRGYFAKAGWGRPDVQSHVVAGLSRTVGELRDAGVRKFAGDRADTDRLELLSSPDRLLLLSAGAGGGRGQVGVIVGDAVTKAIYPPAQVVEPPGSRPVAQVKRYLDGGLADGHAIIPPTTAGLQTMIDATRRDGSEPVGLAFPYSGAVPTVKDVALNALIAGARPEYMPVILTALELILEQESVAIASTGSHWPTLLINGPVRGRLGIESWIGPGASANATIGRAVLLTILNVGRFRPSVLDKSAIGSAEKYTLALIGEDEERSPWEPQHVSLGFRPEQSTVTLLGDHGRLVANPEAETPEELCRAFVSEMTTIQWYDAPTVGSRDSGHPTRLTSEGVVDSMWPSAAHAMTIYVGGAHRDIFRAAGWSRRRIQEFILSLKPGRTAGDIRRRGYDGGRLLPEQPDTEIIPIVTRADAVGIIAAGGPGGYSFVRANRYVRGSGEPKIIKFDGDFHEDVDDPGAEAPVPSDGEASAAVTGAVHGER